MVSVVPEALLAENKLANSMHDPTEGGILGGVAEIAYASGTTIRLYEEKDTPAPSRQGSPRSDEPGPAALP